MPAYLHRVGVAANISALARPRNSFTYHSEADVVQLAAAVGFDLAGNHPFIDGHKRIAFIAAAFFLRLNQHRLVAERLDEIRTMLGLAANDLNEDQFVASIRIHALAQR